MPDPAPLLLFSDDWGRHPSSCQHLISHLLPHRAVTWVNMIGTRPPGFNWLTLTRGIGKLRDWLGWARTRSVSDGVRVTAHPVAYAPGSPAPRVLNPIMWPSFRSRFARKLNRWLLARTATMTTPPIVITTLPLVADLVGRIPAARWVYYCVDDYSVWPGLDGRTLRDMEAELVPKVDVAIAVSETLQAHLAKLGKASHLLTHGVDREFWDKTWDRFDDEIPMWENELSEFGTPLVVFWGVVDRRMDVAYVRRLGESMREGTILFVGPQDNPDPELFRIPRVRTLRPLPLQDLPELAARAAVLIAPYADLPVTRAMQPLKLKEYIATGKPVVVRALPATTEWSDCVDVVATAEAFAQAVLMRLVDGVPESQKQARARLENESWRAKAGQFERFVSGAA